MKILIVCHYFLPHMGGIENVVFNQARALDASGCSVTIVTSRIPSGIQPPLIGQVKFVRVKTLNFFEDRFGIPFPLFWWTIWPVLIRQVWKNDLVHIHGHIYLSSLVAVIIAKLFRKPIVLTQQNTFIDHKYSWVRWLEHIFDRTVGAYTLKNARLIIVASRRTRDYISSIIGSSKNVIVMYNGIDSDRFKIVSPTQKKTFKKRLGFGHKFVSLTIRRITFKNGIDTLLRVAENLTNNPGIKFVLGGTGPDLEKVKTEISIRRLKNVKLIGFVSDEDLPIYYQASDIFVLPSKKGEGFPLVVTGAFSSGIPVIATKSGGHEEIIQKSQTGYLTDVGDSREISKKILYLYNNPRHLATMSRKCRQLVETGLSWKNHTRKLFQLYSELI